MRVLVVAAHPDDEWLGVGGTILRHLASGDEVHVHIAFTEDDPRGGDEERKAAASALATEAGYTLSLGHDRKVAGVRPLISGVDADVVYTHWRGDINADHRALAEAVEVACRPYTAKVRRLLMFDTPSATEWGTGFAPTTFVGIDEQEKARLFEAHYAMEVRPYPHPRSAGALCSRANYWGQVAGLDAAEAFALVREVKA